MGGCCTTSHQKRSRTSGFKPAWTVSQSCTHPSTRPCFSISLCASFLDTPPWNHGCDMWMATSKHRKDSSVRSRTSPAIATPVLSHVDSQEGLAPEFKLGRLHLRASLLCIQEENRRTEKPQHISFPSSKSLLFVGLSVACVDDMRAPQKVQVIAPLQSPAQTSSRSFSKMI